MKVYLKAPTKDELKYRQKWMQDPKTMSYNKGYDINLKGYNKETGTIKKTNEEMIAWYNNWINTPNKYFAYIYESEISEPIGEVYYYRDGEIYSMGILISDKYRGKGYASQALLKLEEQAFIKDNINELSDYIPIDRTNAIETFKKAGFIEKNEIETKVFDKKIISRQLIITKEMYNRKENIMLSPKLETERLILRRYNETDLDAFYEIIHDERLQTYIPFPNLTKEQELEYIKECMKNVETDKCEKWAIVLKEKNETIGNISVNTVVKKHNYCDVGYVIRYEYWGKGYATEALTKVSDYLLEKYYLVECTCNELNKQSSRVMEKSGFKKDGYIKNRRLNKDGTYSGIECYSKTK